MYYLYSMSCGQWCFRTQSPSPQRDPGIFGTQGTLWEAYPRRPSNSCWWSAHSCHTSRRWPKHGNWALKMASLGENHESIVDFPCHIWLPEGSSLWFGLGLLDYTIRFHLCRHQLIYFPCLLAGDVILFCCNVCTESRCSPMPICGMTPSCERLIEPTKDSPLTIDNIR